ncbi:MAG: 5'-deoxynucleotidase [Solobacterium sp.]|nr:5'-deoxynucleotidase [Solobacterium sp.]
MGNNAHFFATVSRMKYINRWALMRNARTENLSEHSLEVAMIAHVLCTIGNVRYDRDLDADRAAMIALYHDASEIITGDMPTPVKYYGKEIREAYQKVEEIAVDTLLEQLPEDLRDTYAPILHGDEILTPYVKAADKLSAYIKCIEEQVSGSSEFFSAMRTTEEVLKKMAETLPEVNDFMNEFLPSYGKTLDELLGK